MSFWKFTLVFVMVLVLTACAANPSDNTEIKNVQPTSSPQSSEQTPSTPPITGETPGTEEPRSPLDPLPNEDEMIRGSAFVQSAEIVMLESYPVQVVLKISGTLPTPCNELRAEVSEPDENNQINVELFSLTAPGKMCIQVLEPFETSLPMGSYESGEYTIYINGKEVGKFTI